MARGLIVDEFLSGHPDWRHLALEDLKNAQDEDDVIGMGEFFALLIACECAKEALKEGFNVVITCPSAHMIDTVQESFPKELTSVYLGRSLKAQKTFDHVIDTKSQSASAASELLHSIVSE